MLAQKLIRCQVWNKAALDNAVFAASVVQVLDIELVALGVPLYADNLSHLKADILGKECRLLGSGKNLGLRGFLLRLLFLRLGLWG